MNRIISAHRGGAHHAPENTLAAIAWSAAHGVRYVELDVSLLGDGTAVLAHDGTLDRCSNASGPLTGISRSDLPTIDAGSWFGTGFAGERLPVLGDALALIEKHDLHVNLELKTHPETALQDLAGERVALLDATLDALVESDFPLRLLRVSAFDHALLIQLHQRRPDISTAPLARRLFADWQNVAQACGAVSINLDYARTIASEIASVVAAGYEAHVYTPNHPSDVAALWPAGLTGVITDDPPAFGAGAPDARPVA